MNKINNPKQKFSKKDFNKNKHYKYKKGNFSSICSRDEVGKFLLVLLS